MPPRIAAKEYDVLRRLEDLGLPAVRPAGLVAQPGFDTAILLTRYLEGSWQYRRLFMRLPPDQPTHRARLFDAMASLLVELHRHGVFWGDCSLANTLFSRDGQVLQAWLVDAETSEVHPKLSRGQRQLDLQILVENVAMGMIDLAERLGRPPQLHDTLIREAQDIEIRYDTLWEALHAEPMFGFTDRYRVEGTIRRLNDLGFAVDEVSLQPLSAPRQLRVLVAVGDRRYHAQHLGELTGMSERDRPASCWATCTPTKRNWPRKPVTTWTNQPLRGCGSVVSPGAEHSDGGLRFRHGRSHFLSRRCLSPGLLVHRWRQVQRYP